MRKLISTPRTIAGENKPTIEAQTPIVQVVKKIPESKLEKEFKRLERVEEKTTQLLEKSKAQEERKAEKKEEPPKAIKIPKKKKEISEPHYIDFICLKKLPKRLMIFILGQGKEENGTITSVIDFETLKNEFPDVSEWQIRNTIQRLKERKFFQNIHSSTNGMRVFRLKSSIFKS